MSYYDRALEMKDELVANRRYLHENAEVGLTLPKTRAFIEEKLREYGIEPQRCGEGVTGLIGKGGKVLLLRADMDALAMPEESGLPFASKDPKAAHCCGHDMHATMLLGAAKMLKEHESELKGTIKLMFQPGEECLNGSLNMLEHGILENPKVDAALAYHVGPGQLPIGMFMYNDNSTMMFSNNSLKIKVKGKAVMERFLRIVLTLSASGHTLSSRFRKLSQENLIPMMPVLLPWEPSMQEQP